MDTKNKNTKNIPEYFAETAEIKEALECVSKSAFSKKELLYYDQYWDAIRVEKAAIEELKIRNKDLTEENLLIQKKLMEAEKEKAEERKQREEAQKREAQAQKEREEAQKEKTEAMRKLAKMMLKMNMPIDEIQKETGLSKEEIEKL